MWFLLAVAVLTSGETVSAVAPQRFESEAACKAYAAEAAEQIKSLPQVEAVNQKCVKVDVPK